MSRFPLFQSVSRSSRAASIIGYQWSRTYRNASQNALNKGVGQIEMQLVLVIESDVAVITRVASTYASKGRMVILNPSGGESASAAAFQPVLPHASRKIEQRGRFVVGKQYTERVEAKGPWNGTVGVRGYEDAQLSSGTSICREIIPS